MLSRHLCTSTTPVRFGNVRDYTLRPATAHDAEFLVDMLVEAVNWRPSTRRSRSEILADPALTHYVRGWPRGSDLGIIAVAEGNDAGAAWLRFFPSDDPGFGFVVADIPELAIAVSAEWRGIGIGRALLRETFAAASSRGTESISLSVERDNPAAALYRDEGFVTVSSDEHAVTMIKKLAR